MSDTDKTSEELQRNRRAYAGPPSLVARRQGDDPTDLHEQAKQALYDRVEQAHSIIVKDAEARLAGETKDADPAERQRRVGMLKERAQAAMQAMHVKAMNVYHDAIQRRGQHQASLDQLQGAVGLPLDAEKRQAEVEKREALQHEAMEPVRGPLNPPQHVENNAAMLLLDDKPVDEMPRSIPRQPVTSTPRPVPQPAGPPPQQMSYGREQLGGSPFSSPEFSSGVGVETPAQRRARMEQLASDGNPK